jgi:hypothetical protein
MPYWPHANKAFVLRGLRSYAIVTLNLFHLSVTSFQVHFSVSTFGLLGGMDAEPSSA